MTGEDRRWRENPMPTYDGVTLRSKTLVGARVSDLSEVDYEESDAWQDYIVDHIDRKRGDMIVLTISDDAEDYAFKGGYTKSGQVIARASVPSSWFTGASIEENRPIHTTIKQRFFVDLAATCAWAPPPPPPPVVELPDDWHQPGAYAGIAFLSERKGFKTPRVEPGGWFRSDPAWLEYLRAVANDTLGIVISILDRDTVRRTGRRKPNGEINVYLDLPSAWFIDNPDPDVCMVEAIRDTYVWGMKKFGWPEPPPLPSRPD
ncbi:hypothetical protein NOCA240029 [metagenome]|uniref:Uncharacterized protein n=1 Tax=metagenome TaxID=256318 RepID=A0A2P2C5L2_9ZZZZ